MTSVHSSNLSLLASLSIKIDNDIVDLLVSLTMKQRAVVHIPKSLIFFPIRYDLCT